MKKFLFLKSCNFIIILFLLQSCHFIDTMTNGPQYNIELSFDKTKDTVLIGEMDVINLTASEKQNSAKITWEYDHDIINAVTDNYSAVITGLQPGTTSITARCGSNKATCIVTVDFESYAVAVSNPYVYASQDYVSVKPNDSIKISASLFGGTPADINGFSYVIDKPSVASLSYEGNYCWITGLNEGIAKLTVKHIKAAYGYSVLVDCSSDGTSAAFISSDDNVITINKSENETSEFAVTLHNSVVTDYANAFIFMVVDELGNQISSSFSPVEIESVCEGNVILRARQTGNCYIRCSHPDAEYSLDILVRVIENAETGYIEPSESICIVNGNTTKRLSLSLCGYSGEEEPELYTWSFSSGADEYLEYEIHNGNDYDELSGDTAYLKGKKTGSVKATVDYPGLPSRSIVILIRDIQEQSNDVTTYITTSQNYMKMRLDGNEEKISVTLKNCSRNDIEDLKWNIKNIASDGSESDVIRWTAGIGTSYSSYASRSVLVSEYSENAYAVIEPVRPGTAYIEISHPKAVYKTLVTVVVSDKVSAAEPYLLLDGSPLIKLKNGESSTAKVVLSSDDEQNIVWTAENNLLLLNANGSECNIVSPAAGSGGAATKVTASYGSSSVSFSVVTFDTEEELNAWLPACIWSTSTMKTLCPEQECILNLSVENVEDSGQITWQVIDGNENISIVPCNGNMSCSVYAINTGSAQVRASYPSCDDVIFTISIYNEDIISIGEDCYLTTGDNVVYFSSMNEIQDVNIQAVNIDESSWHEITWECSSTLFEVSANGNCATITSLADNAEAVLKISHPLSENELIINLKCGSRYVYVNEDCPYITCDTETLELYAGQEEVSIYATLNHTEESDPSSVIKGFTFTSSDESVASVSYVAYSNMCYIKPLKNGTCKIIITHPDAAFEKEVIVVVKHSDDAVSVPYITTETNVITVIQGDYASATVSLKNSSSILTSAWSWSSSDERIAAVIVNNGTSAMLCANSPGTTQIKVRHADAPYELNIIVVVLDSSAVVSRPYISVSNSILNLSKGASVSLTAEMTGGTSSADSSYFKFSSSNSAIAIVTSASGSAYVKAVSKGMAYITVSNSRYSDAYSRTVLVIVEDKVESGVYISPSSSIIKIKPDETGLTIVTASLVNGEATDAQDFIWWADDYNLVALTSVADTCSIVPVGKTGTTKIHIKHAKAQKQADILVLVSKYDSFAFPQASAAITAEKLYFYPMQVPALEDGCSIKYESSNPDVCLIEGSNEVAWVCGLAWGNASLNASIVTEDGTVVSTAQMLVTVSVQDVTLPVISLGNSILTVEKGTSRTFTAVITGDGLEDTEKYNLKWSVKNQEQGISFLNEGAGKTVYGSDCYVTFDEEGQYVISVTHEKTGAESELYIIVEDKGIITIELNSNLESVYKDDGSFTLSAVLTNAAPDDYKNIEWSAVKVGGNNIVSVSKAKGEKCTVTPKMVGQTTVIAKLPNGQSARCVVIVKAAAEISLDVGTVHVIPGYTETVNYTVTPSNSVINWYTQMATTASSLGDGYVNYFSIEDDPVKKQLHITGLAEHNGSAAGSVTAAMVGASSANLPKITVFVEYDVEVALFDENGNSLTGFLNERPDTENEKTFEIRYYPTDLDVDILFNGTRIACITDASADNQAAKNHAVKECPDNLFEISGIEKELITENGIEKGKMTVSLAPHSEGEGTVRIVGTLPSDSGGAYSDFKEFYYSAYYPAYTVDLNMDMTPAGAFTEFKDGVLHLSDGEEAIFYMKIHEENAKGKITGVSWAGDSTVTELNGTNSMDLNGTRERVAKLIWENWNLQAIADGKSTAQGSFITLKEDSNGTGGETFWRLKHNWDYYRDLADGIDTEEGFRTWFGTNVRSSGSGQHQFSSSLFAELKEAGVEYFMVNHEPYILADGMQHYFIPHSGTPSASVSWTSGRKKKEWFNWGKKTAYNYWLKASSMGEELFYKKNGGKTGETYNLPIVYSKVKTKPCIPYMISIDEVMENSFLTTPKENGSIRFSKDASWSFDDNSGTDAITVSKLNIFDSKGNLMMIPSVTKDRTASKIGNGSIVISYTDGHGVLKENILSVPVTVEKRLCEAYTNGTWVKGDYGRYVMSSDVFDSSALETVEPYLDLYSNVIDTDTVERKLTVGYKIFPAGTPVYISIPASSYELTVKNAQLYSEDEKKKVWKVESSMSSLENSLTFIASGAYSDSVTVSCDICEDRIITVNVEQTAFFEPETVSGTGWNYLSGERILMLKDGASVSTKLVEKTGAEGIRVTSIVYEDFSSADSTSEFEPDLTKDGITASDRTVQSALTSCTISNTDQTVSLSAAEQNLRSVFGANYRNEGIKIVHSRDYGYFSASGKVTDRFYRNDGLTLSSLNSSQYETVYKYVEVPDEDEVSHMELVVDEEATLKNKQKALHQLKKEYASSASLPQSSYVLPYHYVNEGIESSPKTIQATPVGRILITYTDCTYDEDGSPSFMQQEIIVCIQIDNMPYMTDSSYGTEVPESYWAAVTN